MSCLRVLLLLTGLQLAGGSAADDPALVAVASSFRELWPDLLEQYRQQTGEAAPRASFASSGLLTSQIRHGAPFQLFLSADQATVQSLDELGLTVDQGVSLAQGRLSLISRAADSDSDSESHDSALDQLAEKLQNAIPFRLAIPNPQHAPYGKAARQSLQTLGLWPMPAEAVLNAENASQTLQFALSGSVDFAIIPDTLLGQLPEQLSAQALPLSSYDPVEHTMVRLQGKGTAGDAFHQWLQGVSAAQVFTRYGLTVVR